MSVDPPFVNVEGYIPPFNIGSMLHQAATIIPDFLREFIWGENNQAMILSGKILYEYIPEMPSAMRLKNPAEHSWKTDSFDERGQYVGSIWISPVQTPDALYQQPVVRNNILHLNIRQASLLALQYMATYIPVALDHNVTLLTPKATSVFKLTDVDKIASFLNVSFPAAVVMINHSCYPDSFYLSHGNCTIAVYAFVKTARFDRSPSHYSYITNTIVRPYATRLKFFDEYLFLQLSRRLSGGLPQELLLNIFEFFGNIRQGLMYFDDFLNGNLQQ